MKLTSSRIEPTLVAGRAIGPVGTVSRAIGGLILVAVSIALGGIGWWELAAALVALPLATAVLAALIAAAYRRFAPEVLVRRHGICSGPACVLIAALVGVGIAISFVTPVDGGVAVWVFLGVSMLVAAFRGYGGCEVLAIPNLVGGRDDEIPCLLFTPIDAAEAARSASRAPTAPGAAAAVTATGSRQANGIIVDLIPFVFVSDVERSIAFYEALGFRLMKTHAPGGTLEFAALESTAAAKLMLARVDHLPERDPDRASPGFLYLYTHSLDALHRQLLDHGIESGEITDGSPGPEREMCVVDPDGHGHMITELSLSWVASTQDER